MSNMNVVVPLMGYSTTDMLEPLTFRNQSRGLKIGELREMILKKNKHVSSHSLVLYYKGKYSSTGVSDKLEDEMTLKQVLEVIQAARQKEIKSLQASATAAKKRMEEGQASLKKVQNDLQTCGSEIKKLGKHRAQTVHKTKKVILENMAAEKTPEQKDKFRKYKEARRVEQDQADKLDQQFAALKIKTKTETEQRINLERENEEAQQALDSAKKEMEKFQGSTTITFVGSKRGGGGGGGDQQVKMLDIMVAGVRKRRADCGSRMASLTAELAKLDAKIGELEGKQASISAERKRKSEVRDHLENKIQASSVRKFEHLISMSKKIMRSSKSTKSKIDKTLARTRLLLARGYANDSHRKNARGARRGSALKQTGKRISST